MKRKKSCRISFRHGKGVKVYIHKDRIGAFHEYGERTGQSFFMMNREVTVF